MVELGQQSITDSQSIQFMPGVLDCIIIIKAVLGGWTTDRTRIIHIADELTDGPLAGWVA